MSSMVAGCICNQHILTQNISSPFLLTIHTAHVTHSSFIMSFRGLSITHNNTANRWSNKRAARTLFPRKARRYSQTFHNWSSRLLFFQFEEPDKCECCTWNPDRQYFIYVPCRAVCFVYRNGCIRDLELETKTYVSLNWERSKINRS